MEFLYPLARSLFAIDSIWSVLLRGFIWMIISILVLAAVDTPSQEKSVENIRFYLGSFIFLIILSASLFYLLFGFAPA